VTDDVMSQQEIDDTRHRIQYTADGAWWNSTVTIDGVPSTWVKSIKIEQEAGGLPTCTIVYNMPAIDADLKGMKVIYKGEAERPTLDEVNAQDEQRYRDLINARRNDGA
jgi:hypothetical protein